MIKLLLMTAGICFGVAGFIVFSQTPWLGLAYVFIGLANLAFSQV